MQKYLSILFVVLTVLLVSCSADKQNPQEKETTNKDVAIESKTNDKLASENQSESTFDFKLILKKGDNYYITVTNDEKITNDNGQQKMSVRQINKISYNFDITDIDDYGNYNVKIKIKNVQKSLEVSNGKKVEFNSNSPKGENETADIKSLRSLIGKTYFLTLTPYGKVIEVKGNDKLMGDVVKESGVDDKTKDALKMALSQEFGSESIIRYYERIFNYIDGNRHKVGDKWQKVYDINIGLPLKVVSHYSLTNATNDNFVISMDAKLRNPAGKQKQEVQNFIVTSDISGKQSGKILLDRTTGFLSKNTVNQEINAVETRTLKDDKTKKQTLKTNKTAKYIFQVTKK